MGTFRQYILSVTAAAIISGILQRFCSGKGSAGAIIKMLSGIFLLYALVMPLTDLSFSKFHNIAADFREEAQQAVTEGEILGNKALREYISDQVAAYILDKAEQYNATLNITVILSEDLMPVPTQVRIMGRISPYGKLRLQDIIESDLGISKEQQIWI